MFSKPQSTMACGDVGGKGQQTLFGRSLNSQRIDIWLDKEMETQLICSLISLYFNIVRQSIQDIIPKAIMHFLVNHMAQQVQNRLVALLYKPELFADMLNEDEVLVAERTRVKVLLDAYKEAFKMLSDVSLKSTWWRKICRARNRRSNKPLFIPLLCYPSVCFTIPLLHSFVQWFIIVEQSARRSRYRRAGSKPKRLCADWSFPYEKRINHISRKVKFHCPMLLTYTITKF